MLISSLLSEDTLMWYLFFWIFGGCIALLVAGLREQKRLGLKGFKGLLHVLFEDIQMHPIPVILGYILAFVTSWVYIGLTMITEKSHQKSR